LETQSDIGKIDTRQFYANLDPADKYLPEESMTPPRTDQENPGLPAACRRFVQLVNLERFALNFEQT